MYVLVKVLVDSEFFQELLFASVLCTNTILG